MKYIKTIALCLGLMVSKPAIADPTFPAPQGEPVLDAANIISDQDEKALNKKLMDIKKRSGHEVMVFTTPTLEGLPIFDYSMAAARHYKIGDPLTSDGLFITVAPNQKRASIRTGRGMGGLMTDAKASDIVNTAMKPRFVDRDWSGGRKVDRLT